MASSLPLLLLLLLCFVAVAHSQLRVFNLRANGLRPDKHDNADGYVKVHCSSFYLGQTNVYHNNPNPSWGNTFQFSRALVNDLLKVTVLEKDVVFDDELGRCSTRIKKGTFKVTCGLSKGGSVSFTYSFS